MLKCEIIAARRPDWLKCPVMAVTRMSVGGAIAIAVCLLSAHVFADGDVHPFPG